MNDLPPLYARWMREAAGADMPRESVATCSTCVMIPSAGESAASTTFFNSTTKCCTFLPELHNFLVGSVLDDASNHPAGTASVDRRIDDGIEVTPLGLGRARTYLLLYDDGGDLVFGRAQGMRCPHYIDEQGGLCGVWQHRESTCATWFCKHVRGATGGDAWRAIHRALRIAEQDLAWWCVRELGLDPASISELLVRFGKRTKARVTASQVDHTPDADRAQLWGQWAGREREFYRRCGDQVRGLEWTDVLKIGGPDLALAADVVRSLVTATPDRSARVIVAPFSVTGLRDQQATVTTYNGYDPLTLPVGLLEVLDAFDGRPIDEVLVELARVRDIEIEPELVQRLIDFGVLSIVRSGVS